MNKKIFDIRIKAWLCALITIGLIIGFICLCHFFPNVVAIIFKVVAVCFILGFFLVIFAIGFDMDMK